MIQYKIAYDVNLSLFRHDVLLWYLNEIVGYDTTNPKDIVPEALKEHGERLIRDSLQEWKQKQPYVIVIHDLSVRAYSLDRVYNLKNELIQYSEVGNVPKIFVEHEKGWRVGQVPEWAQKFDPSEFTAYWLY